jgi:hypothetical protein
MMDFSGDPGRFWDKNLLKVVEAELPQFFRRQRWYPAKDAGLPAVSLERLVPIAVSGMPAAVAVWVAVLPEKEATRLFLPLVRLSKGDLESSDSSVLMRA